MPNINIALTWNSEAPLEKAIEKISIKILTE